MKVADIGIVYLCRFAEGDAPVRRFLASYAEHPAGVAHDLHIILKGFPNRDALISARALFGSLPIKTLEVDDTGYDIGSYFTGATAVANPQLLFLNTFSEILADNWLAFFAEALALPGVGLVGATGSWQSVRSAYEAAMLRILRHPVSGLREYLGTASRAPVNNDDRHDTSVQGNLWRAIRRLGRAGLYPLRIYEFRRHPNPHIRTNAFMLRRDLFLSLHSVAVKRKIDAYKFESGRQSMTRQIMALGLRPVVVDRFGKIYDVPEWKASSTFWIDWQANLLIADNQTANYATGTSQRRTALRNYAWDNPSLWDMPERR